MTIQRTNSNIDVNRVLDEWRTSDLDRRKEAFSSNIEVDWSKARNLLPTEQDRQQWQMGLEEARIESSNFDPGENKLTQVFIELRQYLQQILNQFRS